ncbi:phosphatidate cytidylyltransferase [Ruegeria hyattellae]|uniref:phosphatidate cytidylyltransferase n=1 Tax=Ruegeria hyattellae TaxID=3233337 RepID=UPI00355BDF21
MSDSKWSDLATRIASTVVLVAIAAIELWLGGLWFESFIAAACGVMIWELVRIIAPDKRNEAIHLGILTGLAVLISYHVPLVFRLPILLAPVLVGVGQVKVRRGLFAVFALWISAAGLGFISIRLTMGFGWMLWLVGVVVATDVAGYFVGKSIGGRKFWPRVSPNKTWAGIVGGWVAAALVGAAVAMQVGFGVPFVLVSVLASMASQAGDMAESALKRHCNVKDSSSLIPGHGGFLDRFDGMMGAALFVLIAGLIYAPGPM